MLNTFLVICPYSSVSALHQNSHLNCSLISCQDCENGWLVENVVSFVLGMVKEDKENKILIKFLNIFLMKLVCNIVLKTWDLYVRAVPQQCPVVWPLVLLLLLLGHTLAPWTYRFSALCSLYVIIIFLIPQSWVIYQLVRNIGSVVVQCTCACNLHRMYMCMWKCPGTTAKFSEGKNSSSTFELSGRRHKWLCTVLCLCSC